MSRPATKTPAKRDGIGRIRKTPASHTAVANLQYNRAMRIRARST